MPTKDALKTGPRTCPAMWRLQLRSPLRKAETMVNETIAATCKRSAVAGTYGYMR